MSKTISIKIFHQLYSPRSNSRKRENGRLLIVAGSEKYHGSLFYALKSASRVLGLIYVLSTKENLRLVSKLKSQTASFIPVAKIDEVIVDAVLIGPGMGISPRTRRLVEQVLESGQKAVLDADALSILDEKLKEKLNPNNILTPHHGEFERVFNLKPTAINLKAMAKKYHCHIVLKGKEDLLADSKGNIVANKTGNAGLAKGGSGDVLAGLMAAFFCKNDAFLSAQAAVLAVDLAGDELFKTRKHFYDSEDLVEQLPLTLTKLFKK